MSSFDDLTRNFRERHATIGVIGLGYVGLPLAVAFAESGFEVLGLDSDLARVGLLNAGRSPIGDLPSERLQAVGQRFSATTEAQRLGEADALLLCVPTPLNKTQEPDLSHVMAALESVIAHGRAGQLIILESTTYPGTTEELLRPRLEAAGYRIGEDIWLAFSPERIDPGNPHFGLTNTPKVVGGSDDRSAALARTLYEQIVAEVVVVSSTRAAEMVKLLENTFRLVNIGLVNEFAQWCRRLDVDVWEVIDAASTKPFGFMTFYPGPGLGGHCIPVDPIYLSWKLRGLNDRARFIDVAQEINAAMPAYVVGRIADALNDEAKALRGSKILLLGVAYKANVADVRESPALTIIELLGRKGATVLYADPHLPTILVGGEPQHAQPLSAALLHEADCVVIVADHDEFPWPLIAEQSRLIVDTRNRLSAAQCKAGRWHGL